MAVPTIKYAFCGCSLQTGSKIVAYLHMVIFSIMFLLYLIYALLPTQNNAEETIESSEFQNETEIKTLHFHIYGTRATYFLEYTAFTEVIFSVFLLYGILQRKCEYMFVWVLLQLGYALHSVGVILLNCIYAIKEYPEYTIFFLVEEFFCSVFELYCALIVYNYIQTLTTIEDEERENI